MGRQKKKKNPIKRKGGILRKNAKWNRGKEASQWSDAEFKIMVIRKSSELSENYQKLQGNYEELTAK